MRRVRDSENPEGARNCRIGGVEGLLNSGKYRRWFSVRVGVRVRVRVVIKPIPLSRYPLHVKAYYLGVQPWRRV